MTDSTDESDQLDFDLTSSGGSPASADGLEGLSVDITDGATATASGTGGGFRRRLAGVLALLLGVVGMALAVVVGFLVLRTGFGATGVVDDLIQPVDRAIDRLETRIDQTDDAVDRDGLAPEAVEQLSIRSQSLTDMAGSANDIFSSVQDHAIYRYLPADLADLESSLEAFEDSAALVGDTVSGLGDGEALDAPDARILADELDSMQTRVGDAGDAVDRASRSLRRWIRLGSFAGFLGSIWGLWSQFCLARRGMRGLRGQRP